MHSYSPDHVSRVRYQNDAPEIAALRALGKGFSEQQMEQIVGLQHAENIALTDAVNKYVWTELTRAGWHPVDAKSIVNIMNLQNCTFYDATQRFHTNPDYFRAMQMQIECKKSFSWTREWFRSGYKTSNKVYAIFGDETRDLLAKKTRRRENARQATPIVRAMYDTREYNGPPRQYAAYLIRNNIRAGNCYEQCCVFAHDAMRRGVPDLSLASLNEPGDHVVVIRGQPNFLTFAQAEELGGHATGTIFDPSYGIEECPAYGYLETLRTKLMLKHIPKGKYPLIPVGRMRAHVVKTADAASLAREANETFLNELRGCRLNFEKFE